MADRVLVTGGAGFVGLHLARALLERGDRVTLVDDLSRGRLDGDLAALLDDVELVEHDLTRPLPEGLPTHRAVFHLAAVVGVARASAAPHRVLRTNLLATATVLDWCARARPEVVFLSSTSEVGDGAGRLGLAPFPIPESAPAAFPDPLLPRSSYAVSKLACELLVVHAAAEAGFRARVARYHNVYGARMGHEHVVPELVGRVLDRRNPFPLYGAHQTRAFCHVSDAVRATLLLADVPGDDPVVANVGNDREEVEIVDLARRILDLGGHRPRLDLQPAPPGSPDRRLPDLTRLRSLTGYEPAVDLATGLAQTFEWYAADRAAARA